MRSSKAGFSLIEVVIALAVMAIAFFGMISVITYTSRINAQLRERMYATRAAEKKIEQMINTLDFNDLDLFRTQSEGLGWEQVLETGSDGITKQALLPIPASRRPSAVVATGYDYNNPPPDDKAVLFVRFPLRADGSFAEDNTGRFCDNYTLTDPKDPNSRVYHDLDLDANGLIGGTLPIASCKILPVIVEVLWSGVSGPVNVLRYRYTFYRKGT
jgi:prepilin-type N-terminal cleavage/methylation domain-containing protein